MNRRNFLGRLGLVASAAVVAPSLLAQEKPLVELKPAPAEIDVPPLEGTDGIFAQIQKKSNEFVVYGDKIQYQEFEKMMEQVYKSKPLKAKSQVVINKKRIFGKYHR